MFIRVLKSNQPVVIFIIAIVIGLLWLSSFLDPTAMKIPTDSLNMPFYDFFGRYIPENSFLSVFVAFSLVVIQSVVLIQFNKRNIVINYRTYLPAFFYIIIASSFIPLQRFNPVLIGSFFIFIAISFVYTTYRVDYALNNLYLAGFFIAIATLFYAPFAIFIVILWISLLILRPFIGREWVVGILGFLTPVFFVFTFYFVFQEKMLLVYIDRFLQSFTFIKQFYSIHLSYYLLFGFIALLILFASYNLIVDMQKKKIKIRKYFMLNWWIFFLGALLFILLKNVSYEIIFLLAIPISFLFSDYVYSVRKNWVLNSILTIFLALLFYIQINALY
ncbi:MAG TPA: DUF6427 family protein [Bacteroidales bacterium]|nr:DUF6427 family protein [Bacteroidales bacterium]